MHWIWKLLFPLALPFWVFAEGNGDADDGDKDESDDSDDNGDDQDDDKKEVDAEALQSELAKARAALKNANKEAKERRLKLKKFEEEEAERKKAAMGDLEKAQTSLAEATAERDRLLTERVDLVIRHAVELGAMKLGFQDPADAFSLIDLTEVEIDEETGEVSGLDKALKALAKAKPYLLGGDDDTASHGTPQRGSKKKGGAKGKKSLPERSMVNF